MSEIVPQGRGFYGEIFVAARIIDYLSSGLYKSPAACLKELINNSYDADAQNVEIYIKPQADRIIILDDGFGLNREEFEKHFKRISESFKRVESDTTPGGRPKIGKIGIGFIAANEICDVMEIISTKKGSDELLEVTINFEVMRNDISERRGDDGGVQKADYEGRVLLAEKDEQYTHVVLKKIRGEARAILIGAEETSFTSGDRSLYGLSVESIAKSLKRKTLKTWTSFDAYSINMLQIGLNVPVRYFENWLPEKHHKEVQEFEKLVAERNFNVVMDGSEIRKPTVLSPDPKKKTLISLFNYEGKAVSAKGYFFAQHGTITPTEIQGLLIRIRDAAVGEYDPNFMGYSTSRGTLFQNWISAEIFANDQLEDAMNIDRRTLRESHPAYQELQHAIHLHLENLIKRIRREIYESGRAKNRKSKAEDIRQKIANVTQQKEEVISPSIAAKVQDAWKDATSEAQGQRSLLKKYSVDEFYSLVIQVAEEVLPTTQLKAFIEKLTNRLRG